MAQRLKTIQYAFPMNVALIADITTYTFPTKTLYIPENSIGSPVTFRSATVEIGLQDVVTATGGTVAEHRCGLNLAGGAYTTIAELDDITHSGEKISGVVAPFNFTSLFASSFGTGTSQTCSIQAYFSQTLGTTLGMRNVTAVLTLTYEYDDAATTHIKTAWIPLESTVAALTVTAGTQIGTNQIPQLTGVGGMLPETSVVIRDYYFILEGNESVNAVATDWTMNVQIDTDTAVAFGAQEAGLASDVFGRWVLSLTSTFPATTVAHQFKMWATGVGRFNHGSVTLVVTYEFASSSTSILNSVLLPVEISSPIGVSTPAEASRFQRDIFIEEPGTIILMQSSVRINFNTTGSVSGLNLRAGGQAYRAYTNVGSVIAGMYSMQQRIDSGSAQGAGITLTRGKNTITIDMYTTDTVDQLTTVTGYVVLNYHSDKATAGVGAHNHTVMWILSPWEALLADRTRINNFSVAIPETNYWLVSSGFGLYQWISTTSSGLLFDVECLAGEGRGFGYYDIYADAYTGDNERACSIIWMMGRGVFKRYPNDPDPDRVNIETARDYRLYTSFASANGLVMMFTYHSISVTAGGTVSGSAGGTVTIHTYRTDTRELVNTTTRVGDGTYSFPWYDNTINLFSEATEDATHFGRSANLASTSALNISLSSSGSVQSVVRSYA